MLLLWQALATGGLILLGALLIDHLLPHRETRARRWLSWAVWPVSPGGCWWAGPRRRRPRQAPWARRGWPAVPGPP